MPEETEMEISNSASGETSSANAAPAPVATIKKKRNLPGMPDPEAEVIALSPRTLMATNRFVCEICNKGFQRDQNLQLHRRGHNLPWKLRQRTSKEVRKRVYVCPESGCVHHDPSRALGDLTGIKKHFCRKHGEKKWKCDKCSKKYAVQSDWKAHYKTCGTREYRCDCGTLFSRRDSFITHRAFCDALAEESAKGVVDTGGAGVNSGSPEVPPPPTAAAAEKKHVNGGASSGTTASDDVSVSVPVTVPSRQSPSDKPPPQQSELESTTSTTMIPPPPILHHVPVAPPPPPPPPPMMISSGSTTAGATPTAAGTSLFANLFSTSAQAPTTAPFPNHGGFCLSGGGFSAPQRSYVPAPAPPSPHMSATALLQKAAQMGAAATNSSLLRGFGLSTSTAAPPAPPVHDDHLGYQWRTQNESDNHDEYDFSDPQELSSGLGLGLPYGGGGGGLPEFSSLKPTTLDFLGLGMGRAGSGGGLTALMTSIGGTGMEMGGGSGPFGGAGPMKNSWDPNGLDRKPNSPPLL